MSNRKSEELEPTDATFDGTRPDEEVGPQAADPQPERCEAGATRDDGVEDSEFKTADEVHEAFPIEPIKTFMGPDGMPSFDDADPGQTEAIPFAYETVVCVEDDREYVEVFVEELRARGWSDGKTNGVVPPGLSGHDVVLMSRSRYDHQGLDRSRRIYKPEEVEHRWGVFLVDMGDQNQWLPVRMRRERCKHYRRQVFSNDEVPDPKAFGHRIVFRNCMARRSNGGAYLSLRDEGVYACDYREPYDEQSVSRQDAIDAKKLRDRPHLIRLPLFGLPGEEVHLEDDGYEQRSAGNGAEN